MNNLELMAIPHYDENAFGSNPGTSQNLLLLTNTKMDSNLVQQNVRTIFNTQFSISNPVPNLFKIGNLNTFLL